MSRLIRTIFFLFLLQGTLLSQDIDFQRNSTTGNLFIRMYGEVHFYQPVTSGVYDQGQFDAKRIVALFGYQFDRKTQFVTEWELEHADEIFLEQAFIKHRIGQNISIKTGMILIPMGIVNENHEPNNFFSVDRPTIDKVLVPSTWRDIGFGVTGLFVDSNIKYQAYLVNGLLGYANGSAKFNGNNNYRSGRQKGSKTIFSGLPSLSTQLEYFGLPNGKVGISWYAGQSNTDAFKNLDKGNEALIEVADSTHVFTNMIGLHANMNFGKWDVRAQLIYSNNSNTDAYNEKGETDLGTNALGLYLEAGRPFTTNEKWVAFARYSYLDADLQEDISSSTNKGLNHILTAGINYNAAQGAVIKIDGQLSNIHHDSQLTINTGIGVWF